MSELITVPSTLIESIRNQRVVLFLGAGASRESLNKTAAHPPSAEQLRGFLGEKFFRRAMDQYDLGLLAEMAIQDHGQAIVFEYVRDLLSEFEPSAAHFRVPLFRWRAIATTNYDILLENAYARTSDRLQNIVPLVKDSEPVEGRMQRASDPLLYLKLHGCLNHLHDGDIPLVLTLENYSKYEKHRQQLYSRLRNWAHESTFLFCGYKLGDVHIRKLIYDLAEEGIKRPKWFLVAPNVTDLDASYWASLNVTAIPATFGDLMESLDSAIPTASRILAGISTAKNQPIRSHFTSRERTPSRVISALERDLIYVHSDMAIQPQNPKEFYQGFDTGWGVISQDLDIRRRAIDDLMLDAVINPPATPTPQLFLFAGPAGAGKTIALKRAAWEAATAFDALCLWLADGGALDEDVLFDLHRLTGVRIFLFVDRVALRVDQVARMLGSAKAKGIPITVICAERLNEWNAYCGPLQSVLQATELPIRNLSESEIDALLNLLTRHSALGLLASESRENQKKAFKIRAERQLLVALHEATLGKPFEEIVHDEYMRIEPETARQLYLDICTMHQHGVPARAGTISRISGIQFEEFRKKFFSPLEKIVLTSTDPYTRDFQYHARHARIARLVFEQALANDQDRADQLIRIVASLDIGYAVDQRALQRIAHGRSLVRDIRTAEVGRTVFRAALKTAPDSAFILQQWAIFESNHVEGSIEEADSLIRKAAEREPTSHLIKHTHASICRKRATRATAPLARAQFRRMAREQLSAMRAGTNAYVLNLYAQIAIDELSDLAHSLPQSPSELEEIQFRESVEKTEKMVNRAEQLCPDDAEILQTVARFNRLLSKHESAIRALERSWQAGPRGSTVAVKLAQHYANQEDAEKSLRILQSALERDPSDHKAHLEMAKYCFRHEPDRREAIDQHFRLSYSLNDQRFEARHLHAQFLFLVGRSSDSKEIFAEIDHAAPSDFRRRAPSDDSLISAQLDRYHGTIVTLRATTAFIQCPSYPTDLFAHANDTSEDTWRTLLQGDGITFKVRFNRAGPVAMAIQHQAR